MSDIDRYQLLYDKTKKEFPRFRVKRRRDAWWLHAAFWLLSKITRTDYSGFSTTIGSGVYVRDDWEQRTPDQKYKLLRHEVIHIRQIHRFPLGRWIWPLNFVIYSICYAIVLPIIWTFRAKFEREGYTQSMLCSYELHGPFSDGKREAWARRIADTFGGSAYFFMWTKKKAYAWAMKTMQLIHDGKITNPEDRMEPLQGSLSQPSG
jgi:hypothetical protein